MEKPTFPVAVVMLRQPARSRWIDSIWEPFGVLPGYADGEPRILVEQDGAVQWLHPGFKLVIHRDEAEGYYLNVSSQRPSVFVLWRMEEEQALPLDVTASLEEAGRWLDGGHSVDRVSMLPEIFAWVGEWVENNYRPVPMQRIKPRSFRHPKDRV
jgi:hypothetical protein